MFITSIHYITTLLLSSFTEEATIHIIQCNKIRRMQWCAGWSTTPSYSSQSCVLVRWSKSQPIGPSLCFTYYLVVFFVTHYIYITSMKSQKNFELRREYESSWSEHIGPSSQVGMSVESYTTFWISLRVSASRENFESG